MMKKMVFAFTLLGFVLLMGSIYAQEAALPSATPSSTTVTISYPAACTSTPCGAEIFRCTGSASVCTTASTNWTQIGTVSNNATTYIDSTGANGTQYTYTVVLTQGTAIAPASNLYSGTPQPPLAPATISGATS